LSEGLKTERRLFHMTFATADQKEGAWIISIWAWDLLDGHARK